MFRQIPFTNISINSEGLCRYTDWKGEKREDYGFENKTGYRVIKVGRNKFYYLHRLVARAFVPNPCIEHFGVVHHIDSQRWNNSASNLQWMSTALNNAWRKNQKLVKKCGDFYKVSFVFDKKTHKLNKKFKTFKEALFVATNLKLKLLNEKRNFIINSTRANRNLLSQIDCSQQRFNQINPRVIECN